MKKKTHTHTPHIRSVLLATKEINAFRINIICAKTRFRLCGRIVCFSCSESRLLIPLELQVIPPDGPEPFSVFQRVCDECVPLFRTGEIESQLLLNNWTESTPSFSNARNDTVQLNSSPKVQQRPEILHHIIRDNEQSDHEIYECPVCLLQLENMASEEERANHIAECLENVASSPHGYAANPRYLVYTLHGDHGGIIGTECVICFEEFVEGDKIARLECLCNYHRVRKNNFNYYLFIYLFFF